MKQLMVQYYRRQRLGAHPVCADASLLSMRKGIKASGILDNPSPDPEILERTYSPQKGSSPKRPPRVGIACDEPSDEGWKLQELRGRECGTGQRRPR